MNLTLQTIPSTTISEIMARSNFDGVVLDTEHGLFTNLDLFNCIQIIQLLRKKCLVRVTNLDKKLVRLCLDAGVDGLIFSTVETENQGKEIIEYCHYPSKGGKRGQGIVRENNWGELSFGTSSPIIIAQIETKLGVDNIEQIKNCGFNNFILGPYDLSASLGCVAEWNNKIYLEYISKIYNSISKDKLGIFLPKEKDITSFDFYNKFSILIIGMDTLMVSESLKKLYQLNENNQSSNFRNR